MSKAPTIVLFCRSARFAAALFIGCFAARWLAAEELQVRTVSGREFRGELDPLTTRQQLVLRSGTEGVAIRRAIDWAAIREVRAGGMAVELETLRAGAQDATGQPPKRTIVLKTLHALAPLPESLPDRLTIVPVASIGLDAGLANWDGDVETDGLVVELMPLDVEGRLVAVGGTVEVELFAPQRRDFDLAPQSGGDTLELVERWTRAITPADIGPAGVRLRLPFGAVHPELRPDWVASHYGLVHVRLAAPGHGVFEASRDGVRIQPWAPNRDRLELQTGGRFLWTERLGRTD